MSVIKLAFRVVTFGHIAFLSLNAALGTRSP